MGRADGYRCFWGNCSPSWAQMLSIPWGSSELSNALWTPGWAPKYGFWHFSVERGILSSMVLFYSLGITDISFEWPQGWLSAQQVDSVRIRVLTACILKVVWPAYCWGIWLQQLRVPLWGLYAQGYSEAVCIMRWRSWTM